MAAIIWTFVWKLARNRREPWQRRTGIAVGIGTFLNTVLGLPLPAGLLLVLAGIERLRLQSAAANKPAETSRHERKLPGLLLPLPLGIAPWAMTAPGLLARLFGLFFKTGLLVFGGGLVIIPLLEHEVVQQGWLNAAQFLDGVAIGQITPGPVVLTGAFVGYQAGWVQGGAAMAVAGALVATAGLFAPSFGMILIATPLLQRLRDQPKVRTFLDGVLAGVSGAMAAAALSMSVTALQGGSLVLQVPLFATALWLSLKKSISPVALIAGGILLGCLVRLLD
jgi:chromate transporter